MSKHVKDVMSADPVCCTPQTSLSDIARMMAEHDCGEIPVVASTSERRPVGVITDRDIVIRTLAKNINPMQATANDCMTKPVVSVTPECALDECCDLMEQHQIRRVPVVDDKGMLIGIVAQADIALAGGRSAISEMVKEVSRPSQAH